MVNNYQIAEKEALWKAKRAEAELNRYHKLSPEAKKALNKLRSLAQKNRRHQKKRISRAREGDGQRRHYRWAQCDRANGMYTRPSLLTKNFAANAKLVEMAAGGDGAPDRIVSRYSKIFPFCYNASPPNLQLSAKRQKNLQTIVFVHKYSGRRSSLLLYAMLFLWRTYAHTRQ